MRYKRRKTGKEKLMDTICFTLVFWFILDLFICGLGLLLKFPWEFTGSFLIPLNIGLLILSISFGCSVEN
jgi:hypothetical protein